MTVGLSGSAGQGRPVLSYEAKTFDRCSKSQGQERIVARLLATGTPAEPLRSGTFLEMGGVDGHHQSNTLFLERCLGWRGVLIEANPAMAESLCSNRPRALGLSVGVCPGAQREFDWVLPYDRKGRPNFASAGSQGLLSFEATRVARRFGVNATTRLPCAPLSELLRGTPHIDYASIDLEGGEEMALRTIDWRQLSVHLMSVEQSARANPAAAERVRQLLRDRGFIHVFSHMIWVKQLADEFFVNGSFLRADQSRLARVAYATALTEGDDPDGTKAYGERPWSARTRDRIIDGLIRQSAERTRARFAMGWPCPLLDQFM
jgi:hypothetical protein